MSTSAGQMGEHPTGLWISELAEPYTVFTKAGFDVTIASIAGGADVLPSTRRSRSGPHGRRRGVSAEVDAFGTAPAVRAVRRVRLERRGPSARAVPDVEEEPPASATQRGGTQAVGIRCVGIRGIEPDAFCVRVAPGSSNPTRRGLYAYTSSSRSGGGAQSDPEGAAAFAGERGACAARARCQGQVGDVRRARREVGDGPGGAIGLGDHERRHLLHLGKRGGRDELARTERLHFVDRTFQDGLDKSKRSIGALLGLTCARPRL